MKFPLPGNTSTKYLEGYTGNSLGQHVLFEERASLLHRNCRECKLFKLMFDISARDYHEQPSQLCYAHCRQPTLVHEGSQPASVRSVFSVCNTATTCSLYVRLFSIYQFTCTHDSAHRTHHNDVPSSRSHHLLLPIPCDNQTVGLKTYSRMGGTSV